MKNLMKYSIIRGMAILLAACGQLEPAPSEAADINVPLASTVPEHLRKYVGLNYPPFPEGFTANYGLLILNAEDHSLWLTSDGRNDMLWLSKLTERNASGSGFWEVKHILDLSHVESGSSLIPDGCSLNGEPDSEILVIRTDGVIEQAWRANTTLDVFESVPVDGIECGSDKAWDLE